MLFLRISVSSYGNIFVARSSSNRFSGLFSIQFLTVIDVATHSIFLFFLSNLIVDKFIT